MYDGRKVERNKDYPVFSNYYSDWHQLTFSFEKKGKYYGLYTYEEDTFGGVHSQVFMINLAKFPKFLDVTKEEQFGCFIDVFKQIWLHEWLHLVGLSDEGIDRIRKLGFPVA